MSSPSSLATLLKSGLADALTLETSQAPNPRPIHKHLGATLSAQNSFPQAQILAISPTLPETLGLDINPQDPETIKLLTGQINPTSAQPYAQNYGGHQFGHWADQLGDGRVLNLGDLTTQDGQVVELQLKGSGQTPFSRQGDGWAVLRSSLREFLVSEAMHHLQVPTSRALSLALTGEKVLRDPFYDNQPRLEPGAIVSRLAPSFIRFGSFELPAQRQEFDLVHHLADLVISRHFPQLEDASRDHKQPLNRYALMFSQVVLRTAELIALWQSIGFVHGVMNTDNMSILGLTIDYGPYGFMDRFDPLYTPNTSDLNGRRYCYGRQFAVAAWNLQRLAEALSILIPQTTAQHILGQYEPHFITCWQTIMERKFALKNFDKMSQDVINKWFVLLSENQSDMNLEWRLLSEAMRAGNPQLFWQDKPAPQAWSEWFESYSSQLEGSLEETGAKLCQVNPKVILRNRWLHQVIQASEAGDYKPLRDCLAMIQAPYDDWEAYSDWLTPGDLEPDWRLELNSCSS